MSTLNQLPADILNDPLLNAAIAALLPSNYSFEVHKTILQIKKYNIKRVGLQLPEGLAMWACALSDLIEQFTSADAVVLGDVTYGACCVDDFTARALGCDMMVHYGHSCLVPVDQTSIRTLYVFVEITVDRRHLAETVRYNFPAAASNTTQPGQLSEISIQMDTPSQNGNQRPYNLACVGTVQFLGAVQGLADDLKLLEQSGQNRLAITATEQDVTTTNDDAQRREIHILVPQVKPLSPGEILGCTAPRLPADTDAILYVGDGRFHLESIMIANPSIPAYRYDPYEKRLTSEGYHHEQMQQIRTNAIETAQATLAAPKQIQGTEPKNWGVVLGTLGRQGSLGVLRSVTKHLPSLRAVPILMSELSPAKLALLSTNDQISTFVQTSCPRLSIDWGEAFSTPLLTPYEANIALGKAVSWRVAKTNYNMDFWADESAGEWTPRYAVGVKAKQMRKEREARMAARAAARAQAKSST